MRTLIVGAGGVGGNLGARLAAAHAQKHEIIVLARGNNAIRIRECGLKLCHPTGIVIGHPIVVERLSKVGGVELAILAVKDSDLDDILPKVASTLATDACVLPLLNGLPRANALSRRLAAARIFEACIYVASCRVAPAVIEQQSTFCRILLQGASEAAQGAESEVCSFLSAGGITCAVSTSIIEENWTKYVFICSMAGVTSLYRQTFGEILASPSRRAVLIDAMKEIVLLARSCGVLLDEDVVGRALATAATFPGTSRTSMERDFAEGRPTELEAFSGAVLRLARRNGLKLPTHAAIYERLRTRNLQQRAG